jgi:hypothetical protein
MLAGMDRAVVHLRVSVANKEWLAAVSRDAGLSAAQGLDALLTEARESGVSLRAITGQVIRP